MTSQPAGVTRRSWRNSEGRSRSAAVVVRGVGLIVTVTADGVRGGATPKESTTGNSTFGRSRYPAGRMTVGGAARFQLVSPGGRHGNGPGDTCWSSNPACTRVVMTV